MKILFCHPAVAFSVSDVARGYRNALLRMGHEIRDYHIDTRLQYHARAMGVGFRDRLQNVSKQASETIVVEAMYHEADLVILVSALVFHPVALHLLSEAGIPVVALHTESPYEDANQLEWTEKGESGVRLHPTMINATHDSFSAEKLGWLNLPHAYDIGVHRPSNSVLCVNEDGTTSTDWSNDLDDPEDECDMLFIGTGWKERITLFESIDWTGINLRIYGLWPDLKETSPIMKHMIEKVVPNTEAVQLYRSAKINLNFHRYHADARSLNPRGYELAAVGAFTLTDARQDGVKVFGDSQPTFSCPAQLQDLIKRYLGDPEGRRKCAEEARKRVCNETFDARAAVLMAAVDKAASAANQEV